jgi:hypothetical protein
MSVKEWLVVVVEGGAVFAFVVVGGLVVDVIDVVVVVVTVDVDVVAVTVLVVLVVVVVPVVVKVPSHV